MTGFRSFHMALRLGRKSPGMARKACEKSEKARTGIQVVPRDSKLRTQRHRGEEVGGGRERVDKEKRERK